MMALQATRFPRIIHFQCPDGYRCAVRVWDNGAAFGNIVFVHGIISHGGWYLPSCAALADAGWRVHFLDRRGSGLNLENRGDVTSHEQWLEDVHAYMEELAVDEPAILLGVSWGGKLALAVARRGSRPLAGVGFLCPGWFARQHAGLWQRLALRAAAQIGLQRRRVTIPLQDPALFTDTPRWREYIRDDPFTLRQVTVRFARADLELNRLATGTPAQLSMPVLLMLAGRDQIVDNRRVRGFLHHSARGSLQVIEYPEAAHTLEFEPDPSAYIRDLVQWCRNRGGDHTDQGHADTERETIR